jgi:type IV pilus assembly protein PilA
MRRRFGFTLIELLIVVVIIGIIVAIAIPKFQDTKGKANAAAIKSDLRNLVTAEEAYYYQNSEYSDDVSSLNYTNTNGVTLISLTKTVDGWAAVATHPAAFPFRCAIFLGGAPSPDPAAVAEGVIGCR